MSDNNAPSARPSESPISIKIAPNYNWVLQEPFVTISIEGQTWAFKPDVVKQLGMALIVAAENAIQDMMMLKVLIDGLQMDQQTAATACLALRQQAQAQAKGTVEKAGTLVLGLDGMRVQ